ncbi:MAG TPA: response regulator transcription factor, partial [Acetobacteraceae bacterium]|nr:response regulator transcription factor [Acetobacteraceae bacterium]
GLLRPRGAHLAQAATGAAALGLLREHTYDAVVLELGLPDMEGHELVRRMRAAGMHAPVLVLSRLSRPEAKVEGFSAGADDFLAKLFDGDELLARIHAVARRGENGGKNLSRPDVRAGPLVLDLNSRQARVEGTDALLTLKEYAILELLMLRKGLVLGKDTILAHLYRGMDEPEAKIVDVFVCKLRRKLARAGAPGLIRTVWGRGYVLREPDAAERIATIKAESPGSRSSSDARARPPHLAADALDRGRQGRRRAERVVDVAPGCRDVDGVRGAVEHIGRARRVPSRGDAQQERVASIVRAPLD